MANDLLAKNQIATCDLADLVQPGGIYLGGIKDNDPTLFGTDMGIPSKIL